MRTVAVGTQAIHERVEALRRTIAGGLRYAPCVLLALLLGLLNPALCLIHCSLIHGPQAAQGSSLNHAHHGDQGAPHSSGHDLATCAVAGLPEAAELMPRAAYELTPVGMALAALILAAIARTPRAARRLHVAHPLAPLTPPPKTLAF
jgi:hypothetical protein